MARKYKKRTLGKKNTHRSNPTRKNKTHRRKRGFIAWWNSLTEI